jgi:LuxR family maltose regulon positive regulatory protein
VLAGRPVDALRIAAGVRDTASVHAMTILQAELAIAEAIAHRELGDRARAVSEFSAAAASDSVPVTHAVALAMLELSQLRMDEGDVELAVTSFDAAHDYFRREFSGPDGLAWLARTGTLVALASGEVDIARAWAEQVADPFWGAVSMARVLLHAGERDRAREVAEGAVPRSPRHRVVRDLILAKSSESPKDALDLAAGAAKRAGRHGLVQTVASEADGPLLELLERHPWWASKDWLDRVRKAASPGGWKLPVDPSLPGERLTERELEVLRILPSRLTLKEIAGELSISVNTLKFHLRVIYRKLGVGSRGEASVLARAMTSPALRRRT